MTHSPEKVLYLRIIRSKKCINVLFFRLKKCILHHTESSLEGNNNHQGRQTILNILHKKSNAEN